MRPPSGGIPWRFVLFTGIVLTMVTHGFLLATPFIDRTFDAEAHLFFASHYYQGWFDPWEPRWYGGFFVFSYPPLVHQLVALLGHIVDLESSYKLIQAIVAIAVPASIFVLARELVDETVGAYAAFAAVILSGTYLLLYSFGQLANVAAVPLIVTATTFFSLHLREGRPVDLLASAGFGSAAVLTTTTSVLILPALLSAVFLQRAFQDWSAWRHLLRRALCATLATLAVTIAASSPFWWWLISEAKPIAPIPHFTRTNIFSNATSSELLFWNMYGGELLILPFIVLRGALFQRSISVLSAYAALFAVLGLGFTTPLPRWLFGSLSQILVYDRYAYWAAIVLVIPIALFLRNLEASHYRAFPAVAGMFVAVSLAWSAWSAAYNLRHDWLHDQLEDWEEAEITTFLSSADQGRWTYLLLGLGEAEAIRVTRKTPAVTIDGFYAVARRPVELRNSEVGLLSAARFFPKGVETVEKILQDPGKWSLQWVIVTDGFYNPILAKAGWVPAFPIGGSLPSRRSDPYLAAAWVWRAPVSVEIPSYRENRRLTTHTEPPDLLKVIWGVAPLTVLSMASASGAFSLGWLSRRKLSDQGESFHREEN